MLVFVGAAVVEKGLNGALAAPLGGSLVWSIGLSLGATTGYAINPARDLGPRIMHAILPIPGKGDSDWGYSWIPVVGPILGGFITTYFSWRWIFFVNVPLCLLAIAVTVVKVREGLARGDYRDPGWYRHPPGTIAAEWKG